MRGMASEALFDPVFGLAWHAEAVASAGNCHAYYGNRDHSRGGLSPHDRLLGLRHDPCTDVAFDHLRSLFCGGCFLQRPCGVDYCHGFLEILSPPGGILKSAVLR